MGTGREVGAYNSVSRGYKYSNGKGDVWNEKNAKRTSSNTGDGLNQL